MRVLVTGATGFVGIHLCAELRSHHHEVFGTGLGAPEDAASDPLGPTLSLDVSDRDEVRQVIEETKPDAVVHLAGITSTQHQTDTARKLFDINVAGTANIAQALQRLDSPSSLLVVSSGFVYGGNDLGGKFTYSESSQTIPRGRYGASKLAAEAAARIFEDDGFRVFVARPFNHIGPGQHPSFVVPGLAEKLKSAAAKGHIETGNLAAIRDFTDVRDVVRGYRLIIETQPKEDCFVFGSGIGRSISSVFEQLCALAGKNVKPIVAEHLLRSLDDAEYLADYSLAKRVLGWSPQISFEESLRAVWQDVNGGKK